jgi:hypothetical protein
MSGVNFMQPLNAWFISSGRIGYDSSNIRTLNLPKELFPDIFIPLRFFVILRLDRRIQNRHKPIDKRPFPAAGAASGWSGQAGP